MPAFPDGSASSDAGTEHPRPASVAVRRRLLFVVPFPPRLDGSHGGARAVANILTVLSARHEVAVLYVRGPGEPPIDSAISERCDLVEEVPRRPAAPWWSRAWRAVRVASAQARGVPWWPADLAATALPERARRLAREWRPDVVHLEFLPIGQLADALGDCSALTVLTPYEPYAEAAAERVGRTRGVGRLLATLEVARWRRYERTVARRVDALVAFTARDREVLSNVAPDTPVAVIPIRTPLPPRALDAEGIGPPEVLFVGNFAHPPNVDAALRLLRDIAPRVWARAPEARVVIVGPNPPPAVRGAGGDRVRVLGAVPDVVPHLERAAVVVAPLRLGGGMRVKVLEALAAGKAVVATPRALEGLDVRDGEQARVADDDASFADAIVELLRAPAERVALGARARAWALASLDDAGWVGDYEALYDELLQRAPHGMTQRSEDTEDIVRTADWRFLLPRPASARYERLVVLGASPGLLRGLSALGLADVVTAVLPTDSSASAIAVLPGAVVDPAALARGLAADGALYMEVDRSSRGNRRWSRANLDRALRSSGLAPLGIYVVGRQGSAPRRYMPIDEPGAAIWFLRNAYRPVTLVQRLAALAATTLLRAGLHRSLIHPLLPRYAMTATAGNADALPLVLHVVSPVEVPRGSPPPRLMLFGDGGDRVVAMPFANGAAHPTVVVKMPRAPAFRARTENEQARMRELRGALPPELARAIPEPLGIAPGEAWAATERAMPGRTLLATSGSYGAATRRRIADLRRAADWLERFHVATIQERRHWGERETDEWLASYFSRFADAYGESHAERDLRSRAMAEAERLAGVPVPIVWQHRDFAVWNLATAGDSLAVLDWEGARPGPPLCDLLHLVTTWDIVIRRPVGQAQELGHFDALLLRDPGGDPYRRAARAAIERYMDRLEVDARLFPVLLLHHRLELAVRRADQIADQGLAPADPRAANAWVGAVERLAAAPDLLFGPRAR